MVGRPTDLVDFFVADREVWPGGPTRPYLMGFDPETHLAYKISWCGNGQHSHYVVDPDAGDDDRGWYCFIHHPVSDLFRKIYEAESRLIYKIPPEKIRCPY